MTTTIAAAPKLPKDNPYFRLTPELRAKAGKELLKQIEHQVYLLSLQGDGEADYIRHSLDRIQKVLRTFQEYGFEVLLLDEAEFPALIEALGPLKRAGLKDEVRHILTKMLATCELPGQELEEETQL